PEARGRFQQAEGQLHGASGRALRAGDDYPQLRADQNFLQLQAQLEGTENRITVERQRYIQAVQDYNTYIRRFPVNLTAKLFGYDTRPNFTVDDVEAIEDAPAVDFGQPDAG